MERENKALVVPLTSVQEAYFVGREKRSRLGGVPCHVYLETEGTGIKLPRLQKAWSALFLRHPRMRAAVSPDGLREGEQSPFSERVLFWDFSGCPEAEAARRLEEIREAFSHRKMKVDSGQTTGLMLASLPGGKSRIFFDLDLLLCDVYSFQILLKDLAAFYCASEAAHEEDFDLPLREASDALAERFRTESPTSFETLDYPLLPGEESLLNRCGCRYTSLHAFLNADELTALTRAREHGDGWRAALLSAFACALARLADRERFLINVPDFRLPARRDTVGDFTRLWYFAAERAEADSPGALTRRLQEELSAAEKNGATGFRPPSGGNLAVVFSYTEGVPLLSKEYEETLGRLTYMVSQTPEVILDCQIFEMPSGLRADWVIPCELAQDSRFGDAFAHFLRLIKEMN